MEEELRARSGNVCELCGSAEDLLVYEVPAAPMRGVGAAVLACPTCFDQLTGKQEPDSTHWQCLSTTMWSEVPAAQVVAWRMLNRLKQESWAADSLDMLYLDDETRAWAEAAQIEIAEAAVQHKDSNGNILNDGDSGCQRLIAAG
jgi:protein PhnA